MGGARRRAARVLLSRAVRLPIDGAELARRFRTLVLPGAPVLAGCPPDVRARFLVAVDAAHDLDVRLVLVARQGLTETAGPGDLLPDWPRLLSRLSLLRR